MQQRTWTGFSSVIILIRLLHHAPICYWLVLHHLIISCIDYYQFPLANSICSHCFLDHFRSADEVIQIRTVCCRLTPLPIHLVRLRLQSGCLLREDKSLSHMEGFPTDRINLLLHDMKETKTCFFSKEVGLSFKFLSVAYSSTAFQYVLLIPLYLSWFFLCQTLTHCGAFSICCAFTCVSDLNSRCTLLQHINRTKSKTSASVISPPPKSHYKADRSILSSRVNNMHTNSFPPCYTQLHHCSVLQGLYRQLMMGTLLSRPRWMDIHSVHLFKTIPSILMRWCSQQPAVSSSCLSWTLLMLVSSWTWHVDERQKLKHFTHIGI